jgi:hypothetical protein
MIFFFYIYIYVKLYIYLFVKNNVYIYEIKKVLMLFKIGVNFTNYFYINNILFVILYLKKKKNLVKF